MDTNEPTILDRANQHDKEVGRESQRKTVKGIGIGILVGSGILTLVYFTLLGLGLENAYSIPAALAAGLGFAFGIVAIVPGELSIWLWVTRFISDSNITGGQQIVAGVGAFIAGLVAVATSIATIAFFFPQIMPDWFLQLAENVNFWSIAIGWTSVIIGSVCFDILSMESRQNKARATALNKVLQAENDTITSYAQGLKEASDLVVDQMARDGIFHSDALALVGRAMNMNQRRVGLATRSAITAGGDDDDLDALFNPVDDPVIIEHDDSIDEPGYQTPVSRQPIPQSPIGFDKPKRSTSPRSAKRSQPTPSAPKPQPEPPTLYAIFKNGEQVTAGMTQTDAEKRAEEMREDDADWVSRNFTSGATWVKPAEFSVRPIPAAATQD